MFRYELVVFVVFQWSEIRSHFKWSLEAVYKPSLQNFKHPSVNEFGRGYWTSFEFQLEKKTLKYHQNWNFDKPGRIKILPRQKPEEAENFIFEQDYWCL